MLAEINLRRKGLEYIRYALELGKSYSRLLLRTVDLESGIAVALLPQGTSLQQATDFRTGGRFAAESPGAADTRSSPAAAETDVALAEEVRGRLESEKHSVLVVEDIPSTKDDPIPPRVRETLWYFDSEVLHAMSAPASTERVRQILRDVRWLPTFVGGVTTAPAGLVVGHGTEVDAGQLESMAEKTLLLFAAAYDGESFVIWRTRQVIPSEASCPICCR